MSMVAGTARSMGITVSGDALLIKRKTWQNWQKKQKRLLQNWRTNIFFKDAAALIKVVASAKFDESVDIAVRLGVDPRKESNGKRCGNITSWNW
jgi:hypothetical protein